MRVGINGFGRIGRLALRAAWDWPELEFVQINEPHGEAAAAAHLLEFDSSQGRWSREITATADSLTIEGQSLHYSRANNPAAIDWAAQGVELVLECSGQFRTAEKLEPHFQAGVQTVIVSAPVKEALNIVMGVNDDRYDPSQHRLLTAASCTTNCLAPVVKVLQEAIGIRHGLVTTIHDQTATQSIVDSYHKDLRRSRAAGQSLIPTSTGSATAIGLIFPELQGKLDGLAVRVPLLNASLTDAVFELERETSVAEVNGLFQAAASGSLQGILGYEERPLVSVDYRSNARSAIVDALSTRVINGTQVKVLAWYDNEWGYSNRLAELARKVARALA
ncbi:ArsJ-associated glyceraldehyde-3-phosphate dehydrogenase [Synechococcus elongatus]|uniref:ArsJ-associated glyceraldehyde-3-phosphate dehydrogenase n=1 Tax=Synechococcus elongatus TaxID=32046 RepID=UPI0030D5B620